LLQQLQHNKPRQAHLGAVLFCGVIRCRLHRAEPGQSAPPGPLCLFGIPNAFEVLCLPKEIMIMKVWMIALCCAATTIFAASGNKSATPVKPATDPRTAKETVEAIDLFKSTDSDMALWFANATGYAIFPSITKGAIGIGAAHGTGEVFEKGKLIGSASLTQVTIGLQLGGQEYAEVIFFENKETLDQFKQSKFAMSAQVSAVAAAEGASSDAKYQQGVVVFTIAKGGLMFEASVGGQKFKFKPLENPAPAKR
jgi:lipid-binding SYLF domain-containing protein